MRQFGRSRPALAAGLTARLFAFRARWLRRSKRPGSKRLRPVRNGAACSPKCLTGLRKRGYAVAIDRSDAKRGSFYRIQADEAGDDKAPAAHAEDGGANSAAARTKAWRHSKSHARRAA